MDIELSGDAFDFEEQVQQILPASGAADSVPGGKAYGAKVDPRHRTVVCRHWLHGLCQKGERCEFLHMFDRARMTPCKHGLKCKIKNCCLKHVDEEEKAECIFFKQGFCRHGPACRFRHLKRPPDACPETADFSLGVSPLYGVGDNPAANEAGKKRKVAAPNQYYKIIMCKHWLHTGHCPYGEDCHYAHGEAELLPYPGADELEEKEDPETTTIPDPYRKVMIDSPQPMPFRESESVAYFLVQAPDILALYYARERNVWSVPLFLADQLNRKFADKDHVVLFFGLGMCSGLYGVARMQSAIPPGPPAPVTPEFKIRWLRSMRLPFTLMSHLKVGSNSLARSKDDVELNSDNGQELLYVAYRKPEWHWGLRDQYQEPGEERKNDEPEIDPSSNPDIRRSLFPQEWAMRCEEANRTAMAHHTPDRRHREHFLDGEPQSFVFSCTQYTFRECMERGLLGALPELQDQARQTIRPGTPLFLLNISDKLLFGIFQATSEVGFDMDPTAWGRPGSNSSPFPVQVRFRPMLEAPFIMESDPLIREVFPGGRLRVGPLLPRQTHQLADAFAERAMVFRRGPMGMGPMNENDPGGSMTVGQKGFYRAPHSMFRTVWLGMESTRAYNVPRHLLGPGGRNVKSIMEDSGNVVRIRLRGRDSGFKEGPEQKEVEEPLHFIVSSDDPEQLEIAIAKVHGLLERIHHEYHQANSRGGGPRGGRQQPPPGPPMGFMPPPHMMMGPPMGPGGMMPPPFFDGPPPPGMHPQQWDGGRDWRPRDRSHSSHSSHSRR